MDEPEKETSPARQAAYIEPSGTESPEADDHQQVSATFAAENGQESLLLVPVVDEEWLPPSAMSMHGDGTDWMMTTDEALAYALDHHPVLQLRRHELEIAQAKLITAGLCPNPQLVVDTESPVHESGPTDLTTRVTIPIFTGRKRRLRKAVAHAGIRRAHWALSRETDLVLQEAADAAIEVLYLKELCELKGQVRQLSAEMAAATSPILDPQTAELGLINKVTADINAADAESDHLDVSTQLAVARRRLARAISLSPPALPELQGQIVADISPLVPLETILAIARENKGELVEARVAVTESQRQHALDHAEAHPDLEVGPRYQDRLGMDDDSIGMRFEVDVPIFDRNQGAICESAAQIRVNRARLNVAELTTLSDVASAYSELVAIQSSLRFFDSRVAKLVDDTESLLGQQAVRQGISDYQEKKIRLALARMSMNRLGLRYRYEQISTRLKVFLGQPITQS